MPKRPAAAIVRIPCTLSISHAYHITPYTRTYGVRTEQRISYVQCTYGTYVRCTVTKEIAYVAGNTFSVSYPERTTHPLSA